MLTLISEAHVVVSLNKVLAKAYFHEPLYGGHVTGRHPEPIIF